MTKNDLATILDRLSHLPTDGIDAVMTQDGPVLVGGAQSAVSRSEARYRHIINRMAALVVEVDPAGRILYVNDAITPLTGFSPMELMGRNWFELLLPIDATTSADDLRREFLEREELKAFLSRIRTEDGRRKILSWNSAHILKADGHVERIICFGTDVTENKEAEAEIHRLAYYDPLTLLPNRRLLQDRLGQAVVATTRSRLYGAAFLIDLDNFKALNDTRGHDVGDMLLAQVALRLRAAVREGDTVARQGGDEFMVLMENLSDAVDEAAALAKQLGAKLGKTIEQPFDLGGHEYHCRLSIGVSLFNAKNTVDELFKHADLALYEAKNAGRNTLRFFDPTMQAALEGRSKMERELRHAFDGRQLQLYVQPQVDSARRVIGVEALLRWHHPERGLVLPGEFIPLAEDTGLILPIGRWVLETACAWIGAWESDIHLREVNVSVNVSVRQFRQTDFCDQVQAILKASGANPARLKLELTESVVLEDVEDAITKMLTIKGLGVSFSMDDFGTGYSSLSYLARLPLDQLKIDRSFVRNLPGNSSDETIARTIITLGRELDMNVIAEGVETEAQREFLEGHGCHAYQGYLFGYPLPLAEFEEYLTRVGCVVEDLIQCK